MSERMKGSDRGLFLAGLLVACLVFAIAAAICVKIFAGAHQMTMESARLGYAVTTASGGAEVFKAANGDIKQTAEILGVTAADDDTVYVYYDKAWQTTDEGQSEYQMEIVRLEETEFLVRAKVRVFRENGEELFSLEVSA